MQTKSITLLAILFSLMSTVSCTKESPETSVVNEPRDQNTGSLVWDSTYRPLLHKFTSTGCGGCGRFGIPLFDSVAHLMGDSILPLLTHFKYNDPFINPSSQAIEKAWVTHYSSPQIWINHEEKTLELIRAGLPGAIEQCRDFLRKEMKTRADAHLAIEAGRNASGRFDLHVGIINNSPETKQWHVQVYGLEDSVWASQSGVWPPPHHFFVNRGGQYGGMGQSVRLTSGETWTNGFEYIPCADCQPEHMYFMLVVWEEQGNGKYRYVNGKMLR